MFDTVEAEEADSVLADATLSDIRVGLSKETIENHIRRLGWNILCREREYLLRGRLGLRLRRGFWIISLLGRFAVAPVFSRIQKDTNARISSRASNLSVAWSGFQTVIAASTPPAIPPATNEVNGDGWELYKIAG